MTSTSEALRSRLESWASERGLQLDDAQWEKLGRYSALVLQHNEKTNLTAAKDADEIADRHLADGLAAVAPLKRWLGGVERPTIADIGSGGGFIGVAIQIAWPEARVSVVESSHRKFAFLNWAVVELGLPARAFWTRAGKMGILREPYDAAVERALAPLEDAIDTCLPVVKAGGVFVAYSSDGAVSDKAKIKLSRLSAGPFAEEAYRLPGEHRDRTLLAFRKG